MKTTLIKTLTAAALLPLAATADDKKKNNKDASDDPRRVTIVAGAAGPVKQGTYLGVALSDVPALVRAQLDLGEGVGVAISHVAKDSPAAKAGLAVNDILTRLDKQILINAQQLQTLIRNKKPGNEVAITYLRKGREHKAKVKLAKGAMEMAAPAAPLRWQGGQWQPLPNGLRAFRMDPKNIEQFKKQMEQWQKQLRGLDPEALRKQFQNGGAGGFFFGPGLGQGGEFNIPPLQFDFKLPDGALRPNIQSRIITATSGTATMTDNTGSYTLTRKDGKKRFSAKSRDGEELFDGPVDTDKQRDALPRELFEKLEQLEGLGQGKGRFRLRGLEANPKGKGLEFDFRIEPRQRKLEPKPKRGRDDA